MGWAKTVSKPKQNRSWSLEAAPRRSKPILLHLGHLRPSPVLPLLVLGVRVSVSQAGGVLHHRPKELHRGPLPPERAVHGHNKHFTESVSILQVMNHDESLRKHI